MTKDELEKLLKSKKINYTIDDNDNYITSNYKLKINNGVITYITPKIEYKLKDDQISGLLNMKWEEQQYAKVFVVRGFIHPGRYEEARDYLYEDNMAQYLTPEEDPLGIITEIRWNLTKNQSGLIIVTSLASWPRWYFSLLNNFTDGQNSDGLGEGFEQQDFISMNKYELTIQSDDSHWFKY